MHPRFFRDRRLVVSAGDALDDVSFGPIDPERIYHIARMAVEDENNAVTTDVRIFVEGHGYNHQLFEQNTPSAGVLYTDKDPHHLMEGETFTARFTGATSGDRLAFYFEGWYHTRFPGFGDLCAVCSRIALVAPA